MTRPNVYASGGIDRVAGLRGDEAWIQERLDDPASRLVVLVGSRHLMEGSLQPRPMLLAPQVVSEVVELGELHLLGLRNSSSSVLFATELAADTADQLGSFGQLCDLREVGPLLQANDAALLAYARGLLYWHRRHRFCGVCGAPTRSRLGGHLRQCQGSGCGVEHFPRIDPAVIMLVHDRNGRCLLGRQTVWPAAVYSTLAGFVEPGESLEQAVCREVEEETGIVLDEVSYHSSQPWPFPGSIMLGFTATTAQARPDQLRIDHSELEDACWFDRQEVLAACTGGSDRLRLPRADSIARRLITDWAGAPGMVKEHGSTASRS